MENVGDEYGRDEWTMKKSKTGKRYETAFKVEVLDLALEVGVTAAGKKYRLGSATIYKWREQEKKLRAEDARERVVKKQMEMPAEKLSDKTSSLKLAPRAAHPKGPRFVVRGFGPWLTELVRAELPAVVRSELSRLDDGGFRQLVRQELRAALIERLGGEDGGKLGVVDAA